MRELDADQRAALGRFTADVESIVSTSAQTVLSRAYREALATGQWALLVAILADALPDAGSAGGAARTASYRRLHSVVRENADLLPPEMLHLAIG